MADDQIDTAAPTEPAVEVTRSVELEAPTDEVWAAINDPDRRAEWLDDDDARSRTVRFDDVDTGRRLAWTWWRPDHESGASTVEIVLTPTVAGTRVVVTETLPTAGSAQASVHALRSDRAWSYRMLGLELLFVAVGMCVR